jgi:hypothetical protein
MLLSIFTAAELQVICLILFVMSAQERCTSGSTDRRARSALKEPELDRLLAPTASETR